MRAFPMSSPLLLSTAAFFSRPLREAFRHSADAGFTGVELMVTGDPATQSPDRVAALAAEFGLTVEAVHAPFLLISRKVFGTDPVGKIERTVQLAERLGAGLVIAHPPYRWQRGYRRWLLEQLPAFAAGTGVEVAIENMFPLRLPSDRGGMAGVAMHAHAGLEDLEPFDRVVLDTSHAAVAGVDLSDAVLRLGPRLAHVHLSNNAGRGWDSHLPIDEGVLDLTGFLQGMSRDGFAARVSLELDIRRHLDSDVSVNRVLLRNRELCEASLSTSVVPV